MHKSWVHRSKVKVTEIKYQISVSYVCRHCPVRSIIRLLMEGFSNNFTEMLNSSTSKQCVTFNKRIPRIKGQGHLCQMFEFGLQSISLLSEDGFSNDFRGILTISNPLVVIGLGRPGHRSKSQASNVTCFVSGPYLCHELMDFQITAHNCWPPQGHAQDTKP